MTKITLNPSACEQLGQVESSAEICDEQGRRLGFYVAGQLNPGQLPPDVAIPLSIEETEKLRTARTGRTLDEILKSLGRS